MKNSKYLMEKDSQSPSEISMEELKAAYMSMKNALININDANKEIVNSVLNLYRGKKILSRSEKYKDIADSLDNVSDNLIDADLGSTLDKMKIAVRLIKAYAPNIDQKEEVSTSPTLTAPPAPKETEA